MAEQFKTINLAIELSGLVLCLLGNVLAVISGTLNKRTKRYFVLAFTFLMADTACNMAGRFMRGLPGSAYRIALYASNFGEYLFGFLLPYVSTRLLMTIIDKDRKLKKINIALWIYLSVSIALLIISQFTGLFYIIDADNVYHRTSAFFISFLLGEFVVLLDVAVIIKYRSFLSKREKIAFGIYFIVPLIVGVVQIFVYGIYITLFSEIFSALILFVFILLQQTEQYYLPETDTENKFEDVKADSYYETAIAWAEENEIVAGYDDTHYGPDDQITREQMAAILWRYAKFKEYDVSVGEDTNILDFTDAQEISEYAIPAIQWAVGDSVITGFEDSTMRPKANANRAQMAVILNKIADMF